MNKDWTYIYEAEPITSGVTAVHCDTRDFAVIYRDKAYTKEDNKEVYMSSAFYQSHWSYKFFQTFFANNMLFLKSKKKR